MCWLQKAPFGGYPPREKTEHYVFLSLRNFFEISILGEKKTWSFQTGRAINEGKLGNNKTPGEFRSWVKNEFIFINLGKPNSNVNGIKIL